MLLQISSRVYVEASLLKLRIKERFQKVLVKRLHADEDGAVMVEYALLIAGISIALVAAMFALYTAVTGKINNAADLINTAAP